MMGACKLEESAASPHRTGLWIYLQHAPRALFNDPALRAALEYSFDSGWINSNLFHGQYHRMTSFFPNSELAAPALPEGRERKSLNNYRAQLPPEIFTESRHAARNRRQRRSLRANLLKAEAMLRTAGYMTRRAISC